MLNQGSDNSWLANLAFELSTCMGMTWHSISTGSMFPYSMFQVGRFITNLLSSLKLDNFILTKSNHSLCITNVDPSKLFLDTIRDFKSIILLSATLNPSNLFLRSIGLQSQSVIIHRVEPSSLPRIKTIIDIGVSTRFKLRTKEMYSNITTKVVSIISSVHSGIGVFVPSYAVLESIVNMIKPKISGRSLIVETKDLTNQDTNLLIEKFKSEKGSLLLAVQGGRFSEGENFRDEQMDVSIVVGLSLPPPSPALFAEYAYYAKIHRDSYLLISLLPALRKAFQATGRHIRNPEKRGLVFLLDSRFNDQRVIDLMPSWLKNDLIIGDFSSTEIAEIIKNFEFN